MSRAQDFPAEILDRILFFVGTESYHSSGEVTRKEGLCNCSLTCRYWAERTAIQLFHTIILLSSQDLRTLLSALTLGRRRLSQHIRILHIQHDDNNAEPIWVYQALLQLSNVLLNIEHLSYLEKAKSRIHPHPLLPGKLPAFFSAYKSLNELWLQDTHLHSFSDLIHLVDRLSRLERLSCARITWTHLPRRMPTSRARSVSSLSRIDFLNCQVAWTAIWLLLSPASPDRASAASDSHFALDANSAAVIDNVMRCFVGFDAKMESSTFELANEDENTWVLKSFSTTATTRPDASMAEQPCSPDISFVLTIPIGEAQGRADTRLSSGDQDTLKQRASLTRIEFDRFRDSVNPYRSEAIARLPWEKLPSILSDAGKVDVHIVMHISAENAHQIENCKTLEDTINAKMASGYDAVGRQGAWKFDEQGWKRGKEEIQWTAI